MKYSVYIGCAEWQTSGEFKTLEQARDFFKGIEVTMGLYTATEAWITGPDGFNETINIEDLK